MYEEINFLLMKISKELKNQYKFSAEFLMLDYEIGLVNSTKLNIEIDNWKGCLFHFLQILWRRTGEERIRDKQRMYLTSTMISDLTLLAFIEENQVVEAFNKLKNYVEKKTDNINYKKLSSIF